MATVEHSAPNAINRIPINRRISEVIAEKGSDFSLRNVAKMTGINRETVRLFVAEGKRISPYELEKVANVLEVSIERLKQMDTYSKEVELANLFAASSRTKPMLQRAYKIASEIAAVAIGATERATSLNHLGKVHFIQAQYDEAHSIWLQALEYAQKVNEQSGDKQLLHAITNNLMLTYTIRKEYSQVESVLSEVEEVFEDNPAVLGMACYTRMIMQKDRGNLELAKQHADRYLEHFEKTGDKKQIGIALINIADCEYLLKEYRKSANALSTALTLLEPFENYAVIVVKEYIKSLIKLNNFDVAIEIIDQYEPIARDYPEYWGKLRIMYTVLKDDPKYAEQVCNNKDMSLNLRYLASKCLYEYYSKKGDGEQVKRYYERVRIYSSSKDEFFDEGGF